MNNTFSISDLETRMQRSSPEPTRAFMTIKERSVNEDGTIDFRMSTEIEDRHGTIVKLSEGANIKEYNSNPVVLWMHESSKGMFDSKSYDPDNVLGYGQPYFKNGDLMNRIKFEPKELNEKADKVRRKIEFGSLRASSIGFIPLTGSYGEKSNPEEQEEIFYIRDWTLLEHSIVVIPSNPEALVENGWAQFEKTEEGIKEVEVEIKSEIIEDDLPISRSKLARARKILTIVNLKK